MECAECKHREARQTRQQCEQCGHTAPIVERREKGGKSRASEATPRSRACAQGAPEWPLSTVNHRAVGKQERWTDKHWRSGREERVEGQSPSEDTLKCLCTLLITWLSHRYTDRLVGRKRGEDTGWERRRTSALKRQIKHLILNSKVRGRDSTI